MGVAGLALVIATSLGIFGYFVVQGARGSQDGKGLRSVVEPVVVATQYANRHATAGAVPTRQAVIQITDNREPPLSAPGPRPTATLLVPSIGPGNQAPTGAGPQVYPSIPAPVAGATRRPGEEAPKPQPPRESAKAPVAPPAVTSRPEDPRPEVPKPERPRPRPVLPQPPDVPPAATRDVPDEDPDRSYRHDVPLPDEGARGGDAGPVRYSFLCEQSGQQVHAVVRWNDPTAHVRLNLNVPIEARSQTATSVEVRTARLPRGKFVNCEVVANGRTERKMFVL